ncbi:flagellar protein FlaG [Methylomagnum ishizawai]|uniref:Flagellar protein FlaG n=1 Tax=Methylomagnum ishizawai TaxID=1760988 RepID=A0A1Y6CZK0_9GAMM|nr:flagellar protein FlaG [Methylomagnum ishizawai]BBL74957.1 flagellar protein FlaG [Methylomagnum ishizawai]SMF95771.1 flagellar protein FlaG [Methylomagnum ishizawai]
MDSLSSVAGTLSNAFARHGTAPSPDAVADPATQQSAAPAEPQLRAVPSSQNSGQADLSGQQGKGGDGKQPVEQAVKDINAFFQDVKRTLEFNIDQDSGRMVIQIKDSETKQVIRQIPPEYVLKLAKQLGEVRGLLFEEKA